MAILKIFITIIFFISLARSRLYTNYSLTISTQEHPLPISIQSISGLEKLDRVRVTMSHLQRKRDGSFVTASITAYLYNSSALSKTQLESISILLQISRDKRFNFYEFSQQAVIVSDPNDKPCTEHIQHYLKYFFPCNNYATLSLQKLINIDQLFGNELFFQMNWDFKKEEINLIIVFPSQKPLSEINRQSSCGQIVIAQNQQEQIFTKRPKQDIQLDYSLITINRWYNPSKCIVHSIKSNNNEQNVSIMTYLPMGFYLESYQFQPHLLANVTFTHLQTGLFLRFDLTLSQFVQKQAIILYIRATMPSFEEFETIGGGGQQLMNLAFVKDKQLMKLKRLNSAGASLKLLEPDFSLPFKVITFTFAIIGYLWVNLWRIHKTSVRD